MSDPSPSPAPSVAPAPSPAPTPAVPQVTPSALLSVREGLGRYEGPTLIARLLFAAPRLPLPDRRWAYDRALSLLKAGRNTGLYRRTYEALEEGAGGAGGAGVPPLDAAWADGQDKKAAAELEELEAELNSYKQNLVRKKIRTAHNAIGELHEARGDWNAALRAYIRTQDYCTSGEQVLELCRHVITVSLHLGNYAHVLNYVAKAEQTPGAIDKRSTAALFKAVSGLAHLENRKYKAAARKFLEVAWEGHTQEPLLMGGLLVPQDVAVYGGLCALAELSRPELKAEVLDNAAFRAYLGLVPHVQQMLQDFYESKYASCLATLDLLKNDLQLDVHLHDHVGALYERVRSKALVQYFSPYVAVDLHKMAAAFQTPLPALETELAKLIADGVIAARIDSHKKRLVATHTDDRAATFAATRGAGAEFEAGTRALLLRVQLVRANFIVKPGGKGGAGGGAGPSPNLLAAARDRRQPKDRRK